MKRSAMTSRPGSLVCPFCETGELERTGSYSARCISCGRVTRRLILEILHQMITLPESLGAHACECGHPEMRRLSDGVFHCPACGSELLPSLPTGRYRTRTAEDHSSSPGIEQAVQGRKRR
jgi:ribosomal protein L37AE/L43A